MEGIEGQLRSVNGQGEMHGSGNKGIFFRAQSKAGVSLSPGFLPPANRSSFCF